MRERHHRTGRRALACVLLASTTLAVAACGGSSGTAKEWPLTETHWLLERVTAGGNTTDVEYHAFLQLARGGTVDGFDGCNSISGPYETRGAEVVFGDLAVAVAGCEDIDTTVFDAVIAGSNAADYAIAGDELTLTAGGRSLVFGASD